MKLIYAFKSQTFGKKFGQHFLAFVEGSLLELRRSLAWELRALWESNGLSFVEIGGGEMSNFYYKIMCEIIRFGLKAFKGEKKDVACTLGLVYAIT